ncbi:ABC transporter substrate-binding protein [Curtobacterium sp. MCJR17_055]|uniref:ABC transporter substrate-binding protein n=1 Tax=unclassified Curtobacterium TaxID=257496 RepID=UPI000D9B8912|nr:MULTISPECIES: ABC transporter substrate-binding protein [unclassified Curtobacterium]PYY35237.1 ABC transporter substrate-binding protein [Curtobacterium sp. MCBD17_029]PYY55480.1 ABC transporter substrate-binding protein [Curtobacterium sp. MCJR17_055]PYY60228.1 ABC transporter substrate-binding protein [Curtobacterium sp. MCPF17_015]WIB35146.1 ABC transporter substrate-binding protein [Curtobacterium sp. MCJR17_043]
MRPLHRTALAATALVVATSVALAGCSGGPDETRGGPDATVRVGLVLEPTSLDIRTQSGNALDQVLIDNVYQGLVGRTADGGIRDVLASSHEVSDDGLTYTFTLREGVTFQDGEPLTADDVVSSLEDVKANDSYVDADDLASVDTVTATGDDQVQLRLTRPDSELLWNLTGRAGLVLEQGADGDRTKTANGTGPFEVANWKQGDSLTFKRNPDYWGPKAKVGTVVFRYITDPSTAVNAMAGGDLDVQTAVDGTLKGQLEGTSGITLHTGKTTDKYTLAFNDRKAPFDDVRVRKAIRQAIDPKAVITAIGGGGVEQGGPIPALDPGYQDLTDIDAYDPASARKLLRQAGVTKPTLTLTYANVYPTAIGDVLTSQLAEVGITLKVRRVDFATWLDTVFTKKDFDLSMVNHTEARDFGNWADPDYYFGYDNAQVQRLYAAALATTDQDEKVQALRQAARIVSEDAAAEWLYTATTTTAVRDGVSGFPFDSTTTRLDLADLAVS